MRYRLGAFVLLLALVVSVLAVLEKPEAHTSTVSSPPVSVSRVTEAEARAIHEAHQRATRSYHREIARKEWRKEMREKRAREAAERRAAERRAAERQARRSYQRSSTPSYGSPKAYALSRIGSAQFSCLNVLWQRESGWNHLAMNPSSGAYGIPQSLPASKMASAGSDWRTNPITQVKWGLGYISSRYGSACNALSHSNSVGWY